MNINNIKQKFHKLSCILLALPLVGGVGGGILTSCSDWNDHYDGSGTTGSNASLWEAILSKPELSDFAEVMQAVDITRQHKKTGTKYSEFLSGGRSLTIFAPVNGTFNKDSLLNLVQTNSGDSAVEKFFAQNHLISSPHSFIGDGGKEKYMLLNKKYATFENNAVNNIGVIDRNIRCENGIMHIINKPIDYDYTIYEALTNLKQFSKTGEVLKAYNVQEFNEAASVSNGSIDGVKQFVDSVTYDRNKMLEAIGPINDNDSNYVAVIPSEQGWNVAWEKAAKAFTFPNTLEKRDSLQAYYTFRALMDDAIFSMTTVNKNQKDSLISKFYTNTRPEYHVFYKPYEQCSSYLEGGMLANPTKIIPCCNGKIYEMAEWPFSPLNTYHKKIEIEAENYENLKGTFPSNVKVGKVSVGSSSEPYVSKGGYAEINESANWNVKFKISNTLAAKYDVKLVLLPLLIVDKTTVAKPNKFKATINYLDADGKEQTYTTGKTFINDKNYDQPVADTITVAEDLFLPVCNYDMDNHNVSITITADVGGRETGKYSRRMFLDAIILTPKED